MGAQVGASLSRLKIAIDFEVFQPDKWSITVLARSLRSLRQEEHILVG